MRGKCLLEDVELNFGKKIMIMKKTRENKVSLPEDALPQPDFLGS